MERLVLILLYAVLPNAAMLTWAALRFDIASAEFQVRAVLGVSALFWFAFGVHAGRRL